MTIACFRRPVLWKIVILSFAKCDAETMRWFAARKNVGSGERKNARARQCDGTGGTLAGM